jgi:hypothetical protein
VVHLPEAASRKLSQAMSLTLRPMTVLRLCQLQRIRVSHWSGFPEQRRIKPTENAVEYSGSWWSATLLTPAPEAHCVRQCWRLWPADGLWVCDPHGTDEGEKRERRRDRQWWELRSVACRFRGATFASALHRW